MKLINKKRKWIVLIVILIISITNYSRNYINTNNTLISNEVTLSKCIDGDTAHLLINGVDETVRFIAIDTPETVKPGTPVELYGKEASDYTCQSLLSAENIRLEYEEGNKEDKYGRKIAWVFVDGKLLQKELINHGLAKVAYIYGNYKYTDELYRAEEFAKKQGVGIWEKNLN